MQKNIRIVLVNTSHPGNIGSAARAMKTMNLDQLYLVSPQLFPHDKARELASGAFDVLEKAVVVPELNDAIADCGLVVGASARSRTIPWPVLAPRECAEKVVQQANTTPVAIVFGREQSGLTNEELQRCHFHLHIPSNPEYSSLNIAAAVQVVAYELNVARLGVVKEQPEEEYRLATAGELEGFYQHLENVLVETSFLNPNSPRQLLARLRRLFFRARLDVMEINILRGILRSVEKLKKQNTGAS